MKLRVLSSVVALLFLVVACGGQQPASQGASTGGASSTSASASGAGGASTVTSGSDGTVTSGSDGSTVTAGSDGSTVTSGSDGTVTTTSSDGTVTTGTTTTASATTAASTTTGVASSTTGAGGSGGGNSVPEPTLVTSGMGNYWQVGEVTVGGSNPTVTVNDTQTYQEWLGFGGTFNEAGWDALMVLDQAERDRALELLFSETDGAGFDWGRVPIGASDYAMSRYTLDETANDYSMDSFSIDRDRQMLIPYIKAALAVKPDVRLWATPWSPPAWMKDSNDINGTDANGTYESHMKSDAMTLQAYALYLARFVEAYADEGITIDHVEPQNEPGYATRYPSCLWDAGLLGSFVGDYMGPTFASEGLSAEIWFGTLSNNDTYAGQIGGLTGNAPGYVTGVSLQWNTMPHVGELANQGYLVMQSEHKCGNYPWDTATFNADQPPNDHAYGEESWGLIKQWLEAGVNVYSAWNMVLDTKGQNLDEQRPWPQNALLAVDRSTNTLEVTPAYYVFRHVSEFVDVGAVRLGVSGGDALAFKNPDNSIVAVLYNSGGQDQSTTLAVAGTNLQFTIPARGWATVNWQG